MAKYSQQNKHPVSLPVVEPKTEVAPIASMVVKSVRRCDNCRFFDGSLCRRYPPKVIVPSGGMWPVVMPEDWCGEHQSNLVG